MLRELLLAAVVAAVVTVRLAVYAYAWLTAEGGDDFDAGGWGA